MEKIVVVVCMGIVVVVLVSLGGYALWEVLGIGEYFRKRKDEKEKDSIALKCRINAIDLDAKLRDNKLDNLQIRFDLMRQELETMRSLLGIEWQEGRWIKKK